MLATEMSIKNVPLAFISSANDPVLQRRETDTWSHMLGVPSVTPDVYDADGHNFTEGWWSSSSK